MAPQGRPSPAVAAVRHAVRQALTGLPPGPVLVACSGGADSLALAAGVAFVAPRAGRPAAAVVVDHRLQSGSGEVAGRAAQCCRDLGLAATVVTVEVGTGGGPEDAARRARRQALREAASAAGAVAVLLGHTLDDQAETVLLGLARGSGARAIAGMRPHDDGWLRPLLGLPRELVRRSAHELGLPVHEDPHNADPAYTRVRVRTAALPALETSLGPGVAAALARTADLLRADADLLDELAEAAATDDCAQLARLHPAVRGRVLRRLLLAAGVPGGALARDHVEAVARLVDDWHGQGPVALPGGLAAVRRCGRVSVVPGTDARG